MYVQGGNLKVGKKARSFGVSVTQGVGSCRGVHEVPQRPLYTYRTQERRDCEELNRELNRLKLLLVHGSTERSRV